MERLITIIGPTATGKTALATRVAARIGGEVISADSRQVYRGMDLGTGKDLEEYVVDGKAIPYHLIDIRPAGYKYNLYEYQRDFVEAYNDIRRRGARPILCGGTGLYVEAVLKGYSLLEVPVNEELRRSLEGKGLAELTEILDSYPNYHRHNKTDVDTVRRAVRAIEIADYYVRSPSGERDYPDFEPLIIMVDISRETRRKRISERLRARVESGMVDEVRRLIAEGVKPEELMYYGLEYRFVTEYVVGLTDYETMLGRLEIAIHQFAKRQMTWFRGMERRGFEIVTVDGEADLEERVAEALEIIERNGVKIG